VSPFKCALVRCLIASTAAALDHTFVRGLGDGTLPRHVFAGYVGQDVDTPLGGARRLGMSLT
jgi:thiaminase